MLIEDDPDDRDLTIRALRKNNVLNPVTVVSNGAEASPCFSRTTTAANRCPTARDSSTGLFLTVAW
jgi:two-component system response regulator